ncbi:MAG: hypothetical protein BAA01_01755 [Bacillus thermozeamaize]|uniref:Uncharacterized protein n=1 Tax=Bacillus thermozeamaize TaxID=230954 RepID=A0A1Y3PG17_9BACI|nr:MAG: hypothetical protein BAA01_01755 [Bacillus thermozeamaize]
MFMGYRAHPKRRIWRWTGMRGVTGHRDRSSGQDIGRGERRVRFCIFRAFHMRHDTVDRVIFVIGIYPFFRHLTQSMIFDKLFIDNENRYQLSMQNIRNSSLKS